MTNEALSISSEQFEDIRSDFDILLNALVSQMVSQGSEDGSISVKLDVTLEREIVNDKPVLKPTFKHSTSTVVQVKQKLGGTLCGEYSLVFDKDKGRYVISNIDDGQASFFNPQEDLEYDEPDD